MGSPLTSTPPRMRPIVLDAAARGWTVTIDRPDGNSHHIQLTLRRDPGDPRITAVWTWRDRWQLANVLVADGYGGRPVRGHLRDVPRLLKEAERR